MGSKAGAEQKEPGPAGAATARLVAIGAAQPREYPLDKATVTVGSHHSNDIVVEEKTVSRRHATIARRRGRFRLRDLDSTNGTFVNGRRLRAAVTLRRGDEVRFGSARFAFIRAAQARARPTIAARAPIRVARVAAIVALMFAGGFAAVRYRGQIASAVSSVTTKRPAPEAGASPAAVASSAAASSSAPAVAPLSPALPIASSAGPEPAWLKRMNYYRAMAKLAPVAEDRALSKGDQAHAQYVIKNYRAAIQSGSLGAEMHTEDPGNAWFTPEGLEAAKASDIDAWFMSDSGAGAHAGPAADAEIRGAPNPEEWAGDRAPGSPAWSIDGWMSIPFHRLPILNPRLARAGFGTHCESGACAAGLNIESGLSGKIPAGRPAPWPIEFPPAGAALAMRSFGGEWPDPRTSCAGYGAPSGLAITLQLGEFMDAHLSAYQLTREGGGASGAEVEACGFDSTSYTNSDAYSQQLGRDILRDYGAVVIVPRAPLAKGATYGVSIAANGQQYRWTFSTAQ